MKIFTREKWLTGLLGACLVFPLFSSDAYIYHLVILSLIFAILTASWNILFGFMGVFSFGHQAFYGIGAYVSALLVVKAGIPMWLAFFISAFSASFASLIISYPTFRLKGPYVAIVTLAFAEVLRIVCSNWVSLTRGQLGLSVPTLFEGTTRLPYYYVIVCLFAVVMYLLVHMMHSSFGLAAIAIRESQEAGESLGIDVVRYKRLSFLVTSSMAGFTGAFYAHYIGILTPDIMGTQIIFAILVMGLFGGIGTLVGPVLGAFVLTFLAEMLRDFASYRFLIYSVIIMIAVMFLPGGLAGGLEKARGAFSRKFAGRWKAAR